MHRWLLVIIGLVALANVYLVRRVLRPVRQLARNAERLSQGELAAFEQSCGGIAEVETLRRSMLAMAGHVQREQQHIRAYTDALSDGQEAERARIARDLHDDTVQSLIAIAQRLDVALHSGEADSRPMLEAARQQAVDAVVGLRRLIADLRPPALDELGLVAALRMLAYEEADSPIEVQITGKERRLSGDVELTLYRVAHEALANARRHAQATAIELAVDFQADRTRLRVRDNGTGFEWPLPTDSKQVAHFGIVGMAERVQRYGGSFRLDTAPGRGTHVHVELPVNPVNQPPHLVRDPVCSALIAPDTAYGSVEYGERVYYFCCPVCQGTFLREPAAYVEAG